MKKPDLKDLQLSPKMVTDLTGSLTSGKDYTDGDNPAPETGPECNTYYVGTCDTHEVDCHDETATCDCGTNDCAETHTGDIQCCYATNANQTQCCIDPPTEVVCQETICSICLESLDCVPIATFRC